MTTKTAGRYLELLQGIELATKVIAAARDDPSTASEWLRYRARLYRRLHVECPRSRRTGAALTTAAADEHRAAALTHQRTPAP